MIAGSRAPAKPREASELPRPPEAPHGPDFEHAQAVSEVKMLLARLLDGDDDIQSDHAIKELKKLIGEAKIRVVKGVEPDVDAVIACLE